MIIAARSMWDRDGCPFALHALALILGAAYSYARVPLGQIRALGRDSQ
ncbi:MAG: hypothetical protein ACFCUG_13880 [Thiotrichales bacterium]